MAARKTLNFLPTIFQTDANQKFLTATMDQLVSEPELSNIYGYIGRKFAPTYKSGDSYLPESTVDRENYQLEPSIQIRDEKNNVTFFASYIDLLSKISYYGGFINNHDRLFDNEYYSFNPHISLDKFVNFSQYYWLPDGPDPVEVTAGGVPLVDTYVVTRDAGANCYEFTDSGPIRHELTLARGGTYTFIIDQPGFPLWIQSELGVDGLLNATPTISSRAVLGVENNGADSGTITFTVPQADAQQRFLDMQTVDSVAYAAPLAYADLHNKTLNQFLSAYPQYAGIVGTLDGKKLIFIEQSQFNNRGEEIWTAPPIIDPETDDELTGWGEGELVPLEQRYGVWKVLFIDAGLSEPVLRCVFVQPVAVNQKVFVEYGLLHANKEFYRDYDGFFYQMPLLTSIQDTLWIQDGVSPGIYAKIKIIDYNNWKIDVENDILGRLDYTSPNNIQFTSGLKIKFGTDVTPDSYQNKEYYVEQVGDIGGGIRLVDVNLMVRPEAYNDELAVNYPDQVFPEYITINRSSKDLNAWSRNNRWFHRDVIIKTAGYNNTPIILNQELRARRPIIQFATDLLLFNHGRLGKKPIDILDTDILSAFGQLEGKVLDTAFGIELYDGLRVLFAKDTDGDVRDKIYVLSLVQYDLDDNNLPTGPKYIKLTLAEDGDAEVNDSVIVTNGKYKGSQWWYDGTQWIEAQNKTQAQQEPLFDVYDIDGRSFSKYTRSDFAGTRLFGYLKNSGGVTDAVLGFGLSYRNFGTQGDIEFQNYYTTDTWSYVVAQDVITQKVDSGFLQKIVDRTTLSPRNVWETAVENTKQYQLISMEYDGTNNPFDIDVTPKEERTIPYVKVFVNKKYLREEERAVSGRTITIHNTLAVGDKIDILVYSDETSLMGHYEVPLNLDLNAQNIDITTVTLGQVRNHLVKLDQNANTLTGDVLAISNLRDVDITQQGGTILQHSAPIPYSEIFLLDDTANFVDAHRYAQKEYTKFKNKFLELSVSLSGVQPTNPIATVDLIMAEINKFKNKTFPWFRSDMVPYGTLKNIIEYTIFDPLKVDYEITNQFDDTALSNQAVVVYLNRMQLVKGRDYAFRTDRPAITILTELAVDDQLMFVEYNNTDGNYVPETPTKLGLWPKFIPEIFLDDTYREPIQVLRGHDGSITPCFGDFRDQLLLELELRIFNNIKLPTNGVYGDILSVVPGKFRRTEYSFDEMQQLLSQSFLSWVGNNKIDFSTNYSFQSNDPFTWNYGRFVDRLDGERMPGSWRACYQYFYDTYRPHITPWEMLGFSEEPSWWVDYYGPGPYTGGNKLLWDDLEAGRIVQGERSTVDVGYGVGIDPNYMRPGLSQVIPVDENGDLIDPAGIIAASFNSTSAASAWDMGQQGPVEFAWRSSSEFPFAVQRALALAKPAKYFGLLIDTYRYAYNYELGQYIYINTQNHLRQSNFTFNGDITDTGEVIRGAGYINWIADYLTSRGINPSVKLSAMIKNYQVNLAYKLAGFSGQNYLNILAEQNSPSSTNDSIVIPNENYKIHLYKSAPVTKMVYSAVIVEKTTNGYTVRGYDLNNPYFTIIPSVVNNNAYKIQVLNSTVVVYKDYQQLKLKVPYGYEFTNKQQLADFLISYERFLVSQGFVFTDVDDNLREQRNWRLSVKEFLYWAQQGWKPGTIIVLSPVADTISMITIGAIADGISDSQYGSRILDQNFKLIKNNEYNVVRTPTNFKVSIANPESVMGFAEFDLVQYEHVLIFDNTTVFNDIIYKPELGNRQYRLKLIGQRTGAWDGSLFAPGFIYNSGKVADWVQGKDYLKGDIILYKNQFYTALDFIVGSADFDFNKWKSLPASEIKQGLLPNFSTIAVESQSYYDSYPTIDNKNQIEYSHGLIGFKPRQYLSDLGVSLTTQIEFYKGFIKQKGTNNAVGQMLNAEFNNLTSNIDFYEEWALRVGEYGALDSNPFLDVALDESFYGVNPSIAEFVDSDRRNEGDGLTIFNRSQLYKFSEFDGTIALNRTENSNYDNDIPNAGYVNIDDVDTTLFDLGEYANLNSNLENIGVGYTIWVAKDFTQNWNVFRVTETDNFVTALENSLDGYITFTTEEPHKLVKNDIFMVKYFDTTFDGFYKVYKVVDNNKVTVFYAGDTGTLSTLENEGSLFKLSSLRFKYMEDCRAEGRPPHGWKVGEKVWIDVDAATSLVQGQPVDTPSNTWKVYEKTESWELKQSLDKSSGEYITEDGFGTSVRMSPDGLFAVVGNPQTAIITIKTQTASITANNGSYITQPATGANIRVLSSVTDSYSFQGRYVTTANIDLINPFYVDGVATSALLAEEINQTGLINTFLKDSSGEFIGGFSVIPDGVDTLEFGQSIDIANKNDFNYLGAGAPGSYGNVGYVYVYEKPAAASAFNRYQIITGNLSIPGGRFGSSITFNQTGDWLYVGAPSTNKVYVYGKDNFVPNETQIVSVNDENILYLSGFIRANVGDIIRQTATGSEGIVMQGWASTNAIKIDNITNILTTATGNVIVGSEELVANITVNNFDAKVYPTALDNYSITNSINLTFVPYAPTDSNSLLIIDRSKTYIPGIDYTLDGANLKVNFAANLAAGDFSIVQKPYYRLVKTLSGNTGSEFGYAVSSSYDGAQLAVGAPNDTVNVITTTDGITTVESNPGAGTVWVYDRVIEAFISNGSQDYVTQNPILSVHRVTIDDIEVFDYFVVGSYTIRFINPPLSGQTIHVETNEFNLLEKLIGIDSLEGGLDAIQKNARFGTSLTICSNNCAIYVGAPKYDAGYLYNTGAVWKFHNRGRLYGTNTGQTKDPVFNPNDSIRLDNFEVKLNLGLSGNILANVGEYITQTISGANVRVLESTPAAGSNYIKVSSYINGNVFTIGSGNVSVNGVTTGVTPRDVTLNELVNEINSAGLLGVSAVNQNGYLRIDSDKTVAKNLLRILSGEGTLLADAGLSVFAFMQIIINPFESSGEYFGSKVKLASNAYMLVIGTGEGTTRDFTIFDNATTQTTFDADSTRWWDQVKRSGSVYVYELYDDPRDEVEHPGRYQYAQQLNTESLLPGDKFGYAIDIESGYILVSSLAESVFAPRTGSIYVFENPTGKRGWNLIRYQEESVDTDSLNRIYLYDKKSNTILVNLQYIDPAKGRILGEADQEITYKTAFDPARYNRGTVAVTTDLFWGTTQVGQVWWNLDRVRFVNYEQDTLTYRSINWGRLFPGSLVEVCEWVESDVLPSQYVNAGYDGIPKYADDSAYVEIISVDPVTGIIRSLYYFWVTDKTTVNLNNPRRNIPLTTIASYISNPKSQGIPYAAIIKNNAIILYNIGNYLSSKDTILHIDHDLLMNTNIIHSEYHLVQKGNPKEVIPDKIIVKLIDSLAGIDPIGAVVPDPKLSDADRYGIGFRPRQSMFVNRQQALNELVAFVNAVLITYPVSRTYDLTQMYSSEPEPDIRLNEYNERIETDTYLYYIDTDNLPVGYKVLVASDATQDNLWVLYELDADKVWQIVKVQSYKTDLYWEYVDWYATGFDATEIIEYVVDTLPDALKLPARPGEEILVKVNKSNIGQGWNLITVLDDGSFEVVGIEKGTIQLKSAIGDFANNQLGFGNQGFESNRFDQNPNLEIRNIINALRDDIFINDLGAKFNELFFAMVNYLFTEQKYVDWIFKTSFISVVHQLRTLSQFPSYIEDNQTYYRNYIEEVKPYRTKIREYTIDYKGDDLYEGAITDFDLPPYYDQQTMVFRSPSGEDVAKDEALWQLEPYNDWYQNRTYSVVSIVVTDPGAGYTTAPAVIVMTSGAGGGGTTAEAFIDGDTGEVVRIDVITPGGGYTRTPTVIINGSSDRPARGYAIIENPLVRTFDTTMKFDRISYTTSVKEWAANTYYQTGDIITYAIQEGDTYVRKSYLVTANVTSGNTFVASDYTPYSANAFANANDRIWGYYQPGIGMPARDLRQLVYGVEYPGVQVTGLNFSEQPGFSGAAVVQLTLNANVTVYAGNIITQGNANVTVTNTRINTNTIYGELNSGANFSTTGANISVNGIVTTVRPISTLFVPSTAGTKFDTNGFDNIDYDEDGIAVLDDQAVDTVIRSTYIDTALGTRPEDVIVDGGAYVDTYSSHAPEELIPGILFDTLDMQIYTKINSNVDVLGYRIFDNMNRETSYLRIADRYTTSLVLPLEDTDSEIYVEDATVLPRPNPSTAQPGVIFIGSERITYYRNYAQELLPWVANVFYKSGSIVSYEGNNYITTEDIQSLSFDANLAVQLNSINVLAQIRRGTQGTAMSRHGIGARVIDSSVVQEIPDTISGETMLTSNTAFRSAGNVTYALYLTGNITANVGDNITQVTSLTDVTVVGRDTTANILYINYNSSYDFNYVAANIGATSNLAVNGVYTGIYPISTAVRGKVDSFGNVTVAANTTLITSNVWYNTGTFTATDGTGFEGAITTQVLFLKEETANDTLLYTVSDEIVTEDAINTLITEDGQLIIEEDQE